MRTANVNAAVNANANAKSKPSPIHNVFSRLSERMPYLIPLLSKLENVFVYAVLFLFSQAFYEWLRPGVSAAQAEGDAFMQKIWMVVYALTFVVCAVRWREIRNAVLSNKWLLVLLVYTAASTLWSHAPDVTMRRTFALGATSLFGIYLATRYTLGEMFRKLSTMMLITLVASFITAILLPAQGTMAYEGQSAWKGVFLHKNQLGRMMSLCAVAFTLIAWSDRKGRWKAIAVVLLSFVLILQSNSATALTLGVTLLCLLPVLQIFRWLPSLQVLVFMSILIPATIGFVLVMENWEEFLLWMGRDLTLTGRTDLWRACWDMIQLQPWLGYGFSAFWLGMEGDSAEIWMRMDWEPPHAHNGILNVWLELGVFGVAWLVISLLLNMVRAVGYMRSRSSLIACWPLVYMTFILANNVTESLAMRQNSLFWMLYVALSAGLIASGSSKSKGMGKT